MNVTVTKTYSLSNEEVKEAIIAHLREKLDIQHHISPDDIRIYAYMEDDTATATWVFRDGPTQVL